MPGPGEVPSHGAERRSALWRSPIRKVRGRIGLVIGDITAPGPGDRAPPAPASSRKSLREAYHLAAVYDLAVERDVARRINVEGTKNVLEFLESAKGFERLHYVSTAYVSGTARGRLPRDRPRRRPGVQEPLRGDEIPGGGGGRAQPRAPHDLPPRGGGRRLADRRDRQVRWSLLRAPGDGAAAVRRGCSSASASARAPSASCPWTSWWKRSPRSPPPRRAGARPIT